MNTNRQEENRRDRKLFFIRTVWLSPLFYIYFLCVVVAVGLLYVANLGSVNRNSVSPDVHVDSIYSAPITDLPFIKGSVSPPINLLSLLQPSTEEVEKGRVVFKTYCVSCHGDSGFGNGPASASLVPKPRNFHSDSGWVNGRTLSALYKTLMEGVPGSAMVSYATLPLSDRFAVLQYVRTFSDIFPSVTQKEVEALDQKYHLTSGEVIPSQIPVALAMQKISAEVVADEQRIAAIMMRIARQSSEPGSEIFRSVAADQKRALVMLLNSKLLTQTQPDFVTAVVSNAGMNGFHSNVSRLSPDEWETMYRYLKRVFTEK
ncbi:MAG: c-type cytochrome [Bacteroidota bacterium]